MNIKPINCNQRKQILKSNTEKNDQPSFGMALKVQDNLYTIFKKGFIDYAEYMKEAMQDLKLLAKDFDITLRAKTSYTGNVNTLTAIVTPVNKLKMNNFLTRFIYKENNLAGKSSKEFFFENKENLWDIDITEVVNCAIRDYKLKIRQNKANEANMESEQKLFNKVDSTIRPMFKKLLK